MHPLDVALEHGLHGRFAEGEAVLRTIEEDPRAQFNLGWYSCRESRWSEASMQLDTGRLLNCYGSAPLKNGRPIWNGQSLVDRTVHLRCEGGFGDEIIGLRWTRNLASLGARVHVSCSPGLASLFARAPGVSAVTTFEGADHVHCDYWIPAMSGARWFEPRGERYLEADTEKAETFASMMHVRDGGRPRVGLRWSGNPKFEGEQHRKFEPGLMYGLARKFADRFAFYSLQVGNDQIHSEDFADLEPMLTDWDCTAAAIVNLDLVITSCTGVAHCAAALGVPTWVVVPLMPYYLWAAPGDRPVWYDSVRLFRQTRYERWYEPFAEIRRQLAKLSCHPKSVAA